MTEVEIQDQILTLTITAVDPVAFAMTWLLAWVAKTSAVEQAPCRDEIASLGDDPDPLAFIQLPYLSATCQEMLRIHPILPTVEGRRLTAPMDDPGIRPRRGGQRRSLRIPGASARGSLPRAAGVPPGTFPEPAIQSVRVLPLRGEQSPLPGYDPRPHGDEAGPGEDPRAGRLVLENAGGPDVRYGTMVAAGRSAEDHASTRCETCKYVTLMIELISLSICGSMNADIEADRGRELT